MTGPIDADACESLWAAGDYARLADGLAGHSGGDRRSLATAILAHVQALIAPNATPSENGSETNPMSDIARVVRAHDAPRLWAALGEALASEARPDQAAAFAQWLIDTQRAVPDHVAAAPFLWGLWVAALGVLQRSGEAGELADALMRQLTQLTWPPALAVALTEHMDVLGASGSAGAATLKALFTRVVEALPHIEAASLAATAYQAMLLAQRDPVDAVAAQLRVLVVLDQRFGPELSGELEEAQRVVLAQLGFLMKHQAALGRALVTLMANVRRPTLSRKMPNTGGRVGVFCAALLLYLFTIPAFSERVFEFWRSAAVQHAKDAAAAADAERKWSRAPAAAAALFDPGAVLQRVAQLSGYGFELPLGSLQDLAARLLVGGTEVRLATRLLQLIFEHHAPARRQIVKAVVEALLAANSDAVRRASLKLFGKLLGDEHSATEYASLVASSGMERLTMLSPQMARAFLCNAAPLLSSAVFRDRIMMVLRKAQFAANVETRQSAAAMLIAVVETAAAAGNGRLSAEALAAVRQSLSQQAPVRECVYREICASVSRSSAAAELFGEILADHVELYLGSDAGDDGAGAPLQLGQCLQPDGRVVEPLGMLVRALGACERAGQMAAAERLVTQLATGRLASCELVDLEIHSGASFDQSTQEGAFNVALAQLVMGLCEACLEHLLLETPAPPAAIQRVVVAHSERYATLRNLLQQRGTCPRGRKLALEQMAPETLGAVGARELLRVLFAAGEGSGTDPASAFAFPTLAGNVPLAQYAFSAARRHLADAEPPVNLAEMLVLTALTGIVVEQFHKQTSEPGQADRPDQERAAASKCLVPAAMDAFQASMRLLVTQTPERLDGLLSQIAADLGVALPDPATDAAEFHRFIFVRLLLKFARLFAVPSAPAALRRAAAQLCDIVQGMVEGLGPAALGISSAHMDTLVTQIRRLCSDAGGTLDSYRPQGGTGQCDAALAGAFVRVLLATYTRVEFAQAHEQLLLDVAHDLACLHGTWDTPGGVLEHADASDMRWRLVNAKSAPALLTAVLATLQSELDHALWAISTLKRLEVAVCASAVANLDSGADPELLRDAEAAATALVASAVRVLSRLLDVHLGANQSVAVARSVPRLFRVLTALVRWRTHFEPRSLPEPFIELVNAVSADVLPKLYAMIAQIQRKQQHSPSDAPALAGAGRAASAGNVAEPSGRAEPAAKKGKAAAAPGGRKARDADRRIIVREMKIVPQLVFLMEQYERHVLQLSKRGNCPALLRNAKRSTVRDFKINWSDFATAVDQAAVDWSDGESGSSGTENRPAKGASGTRRSRGGAEGYSDDDDDEIARAKRMLHEGGSGTGAPAEGYEWPV